MSIYSRENGYTHKVVFTKTFLRGNLKGLTYTESGCPFPSERLAKIYMADIQNIGASKHSQRYLGWVPSDIHIVEI